MSKRGTSFKLEQRHLEILETKARELGIGKSEYLRNLIDHDHKTILNSETRDLTIETKNARNLSLNEINLIVIKSLTREFDPTVNAQKPLNTIRGFAKKYDLKSIEVEGILNQLVRNGILTIKKNKSGKQGYQWTYLGIVALPEYAPVDDDDRNLISGSAIGAISGMLGEYEEIVDYLCDILNIEKNKADSIIRFFLFNYVGYLEWLREIIFPITGVNDQLDHKYYRDQMVDYLLILIRNSQKWKDWKTDEILDMKDIQRRILKYRIEKNDV
jgi:hypothetical protein